MQPPEDEDGPPGETEKKPVKRRKGLGTLAYFLLKLFIVLVLGALTFTFVLGVHIQNGMSMYPHIKDGDLLITYKLDSYAAGDVVLYRDPDTGERRISRIKVKGDNEIDITDSGELLVNGAVVETDHYYSTMRVSEGGIEYPYQVSGDGIFLLNDYRNSARDSRLFGQFLEEDLLGKVVYVFRRRGI